MKILILSSEPNSYSSKRLAEECKKRKDVEHEIINPNDLFSFISSTTSGHDRLYRKSNESSEKILSKSFDAVIPRVAGGNFDHAVMVVKQINENLGKFSTGTEYGLKICSNKLTTSQVLSAAKVRVPKQVLSYRPADYGELIDLVGGLPAVAKLQRGSQGDGVMILNDSLAASTSLKSFERLGASVILQQFIDTGEPANDIRVIVIGPEKKEPVLFSYKRYALASDFRSNYSISGLGEKVSITDEERQMAIDAAKAVSCGVSGVDIMRDVQNDNKPYVIEVNGSPGLKGIEKVSGENVAGAIVDYVFENYKKGGGRMKQVKAFDNLTLQESIQLADWLSSEGLIPLKK